MSHVLEHDSCNSPGDYGYSGWVQFVREQDVMRENVHTTRPPRSHYVLSEDEGRTWSTPRPTPFYADRPAAGLLHSGRLLVTYRNVEPARDERRRCGKDATPAPGPGSAIRAALAARAVFLFHRHGRADRGGR